MWEFNFIDLFWNVSITNVQIELFDKRRRENK